MIQDGIARDLGLNLRSAKTWRKRAVARRGIHVKNELFAVFWPDST